MNDSQKDINFHGFTLPELMFVLSVIIIIVVIAIPSFFNQAGKAKESEPKRYVGSRIRAQQAYYLKNNGFAKEDLGQLDLAIPTETENYFYFGKLRLAIPTETENYFYIMRASSKTAFHYAIPRDRRLRGYVGGVFVGVDPASLEKTTLAILCGTTDPGRFLPAKPQMKNGVPTCGAGTEPL